MKVNDLINLFEDSLTDRQVMELYEQSVNGDWSEPMTLEESIAHDRQIIEESKKKRYSNLSYSSK